MKKKINSLAKLASAATLVFTLNLASTAGQAQTRHSDLPQTGFWVVETGARAKDGSTLRFYNDDKQLIYEEHLAGTRLDVRRSKTVAFLNRALDKMMVNWLVTRQVKTDGHWVAELRKR